MIEALADGDLTKNVYVKLQGETKSQVVAGALNRTIASMPGEAMTLLAGTTNALKASTSGQMAAAAKGSYCFS